MRKTIKLIFVSVLMLSWAFMLPGYSYAQSYGDSIITIDGNTSGRASAYYNEGRMYVSASQTARSLGGKTDFMPASGIFVLSAKGSRMLLRLDSNTVDINGQKKEFVSPLVIHDGQVYVYAGCIESAEFSSQFGKKIAFVGSPYNDGKSKDLSENKSDTAAYSAPSSTAVARSGKQAALPATPSITSARCADHQGRTSLVLVADSPVNWIEQRSGRILRITLPGAKSDGIITEGLSGKELNSVSLSTSAYGTELTLSLSETAGETVIFSLTDPYRISVDVYDVSSPPSASTETVSAANPVYVQEVYTAMAVPAGKIVPLPSVMDEIIEEPEISDEEIEYIEYPASVQENVPVQPARIRVLRTKGRPLKVSSGPVANMEISAAVMSGLKASGIDLSYLGESAVSRTAIPVASVSATIRTGNGVSQTIQNGKRIILLDPSCGGEDNGGRKRFGLSEKHYSLLLARDIQNMFSENPNLQAVLTRDGDVSMSVSERIGISEKINAGIMISIHANSSENPKKNGFEVYSYYGKADGAESNDELRSESRILAGILSSEMEKWTYFRNNGTRQDNAELLRLAKIPSVMVFAGYMTNTHDKKLMDGKYSRRRIARSIYNGIMAYARTKGWTE